MNQEDNETNIFSLIKRKILRDYKNEITDDNSSTCLVIYSIFFVFILVTPFFLYNLAYSEVAINQNTMNSYIFYIILFVILFGSVFFLENQSKILPNNRNVNTVVAFVTMIFSILILGLIMYFYKNMSKYDLTITKYMNAFLYIIVFLIVIITLAISFKIFSNTLQRQRGVIGFIINFIFFIPCLFSDFIDFIKYQYKITPSSIYILLLIEIILIIAYIYIPILIDSNINNDKIILLPDSKFLDKPLHIGSNDNLAPFIKKDLAGNEIKTSRVNYGLSLWIYLNQPTNKRKNKRLINIISYGTKESMKPQISFFEKENNNDNKNTYRITFTGEEEIIHNNRSTNSYDIDLTNQKWHHIFFNYLSDHVDLFIDGNLERTFTMNGTYTKYGVFDKIIIGDDNGVDGAICNVTYYKNTLSKFQITNLYNLLMNKNPPINNIV